MDRNGTVSPGEVPSFLGGMLDSPQMVAQGAGHPNLPIQSPEFIDRQSKGLPGGYVNTSLLNMASRNDVSFPIQHGDFP